jgi:hypothetical protein
MAGVINIIVIRPVSSWPTSARSYFPVFGRLLTFLCDHAGYRNGARGRWMLQELTFVDSVLLIRLITLFDLAAVRGKFSCKNTPKFTARPG